MFVYFSCGPYSMLHTVNKLFSEFTHNVDNPFSFCFVVLLKYKQKQFCVFKLVYNKEVPGT